MIILAMPTFLIFSMSGSAIPLKTIVPSTSFLHLQCQSPEELVATPYRHGNKKNAEEFILEWHDGGNA